MWKYNDEILLIKRKESISKMKLHFAICLFYCVFIFVGMNRFQELNNNAFDPWEKWTYNIIWLKMISQETINRFHSFIPEWIPSNRVNSIIELFVGRLSLRVRVNCPLPLKLIRIIVHYINVPFHDIIYN